MIFYLISITITGFVCYVYGMACLKLLKNLFKEDGTNISMPIVLLLGMFLVSSIFTLYSFVLPLNASAFSVAILVSFLLFFLLINDLSTLFIVTYDQLLHKHLRYRFLGITLLLFVLVVGQYPPLNGDTGYYHAQTIRWLEEFGTVTGLGNLFIGYAHNNSWFILESLFSQPWLIGSPLHVMNGLMFIVMFYVCLSGADEITRKKLSFSSLLKLTVLPFYVLYISQNIASLSPDLPASIIVVITLIYIVELLERKTIGTLEISILLILSLYAITIKLNTVPIIFTIFYILFNKKMWKNLIENFIHLCFITVIALMPWMISGFLLSGYLVFPVNGTDVMAVDWRIPPNVLNWYRSFTYEVAWNPVVGGAEFSIPKVEGGSHSFFSFPIPIFDWIPVWLMQYSLHVKLLIYSCAASLVSFSITVVLIPFSKRIKSKIWVRHYLFVSVFCITGIIYWFINAPYPRLGYAYLIIFVAAQFAFWVMIFNGCSWYRIIINLGTVFSILFLLFTVEMQNFIVQRTLTEELYNTLAESVDSKGKKVLNTTYAYDHKSEVYRLKLLLPLMEKIRVVRTFLTSDFLDYYSNADKKYPQRSEKGYYRPVDGLFALSKRILFPSLYPVNPVKEVKLRDITFYEMNVPLKSWGGWYESFPFSTGNLENLELRGNTLKQGFRVTE